MSASVGCEERRRLVAQRGGYWGCLKLEAYTRQLLHCLPLVMSLFTSLVGSVVGFLRRMTRKDDKSKKEFLTSLNGVNMVLAPETETEAVDPHLDTELELAAKNSKRNSDDLVLLNKWLRCAILHAQEHEEDKLEPKEPVVRFDDKPIVISQSKNSNVTSVLKKSPRASLKTRATSTELGTFFTQAIDPVDENVLDRSPVLFCLNSDQPLRKVQKD